MKPIPSRRQAGFSLIELMVAVTIGLFMLAIIGGIYVSTTRSFAATSAVTGMDENARALFDMIGSSVRQAAIKGCGRVASLTNGDTRNISVTGGIPNNWWQNTVQPVQGRTLTAAAPGFPGSYPTAGMDTDVLMLVGADSQNAATVASDDGAQITLGTPLSGPAPAFAAGQALLASSCQVNSFFIATTGGSTIEHVQGASNCSASLDSACALVSMPSGAVSSPPILPVGALVMPVVANAYYVAPSKVNPAGKGNSLWSCIDGNTDNCTELSNGVENMVVYFGLDTDGDNAVDSWARPGQMPTAPYTGPGGASQVTPRWDQVMAVQVHLLLATLPDAGAVSSGGNAYTFDGGAPVTPTDHRVYREYTAVFSVRNNSY